MGDDSKYELVPRPVKHGGLWLTEELLQAVRATLSTTKAVRLKQADVGGRATVNVNQALRTALKGDGKLHVRSDGDDIIVWLEELKRENPK
jgi:hypothetical protein